MTAQPADVEVEVEELHRVLADAAAHDDGYTLADAVFTLLWDTHPAWREQEPT